MIAVNRVYCEAAIAGSVWYLKLDHENKLNLKPQRLRHSRSYKSRAAEHRDVSLIHSSGEEPSQVHTNHVNLNNAHCKVDNHYLHYSKCISFTYIIMCLWYLCFCSHKGGKQVCLIPYQVLPFVIHCLNPWYWWSCFLLLKYANAGEESCGSYEAIAICNYLPKLKLFILLCSGTLYNMNVKIWNHF